MGHEGASASARHRPTRLNELLEWPRGVARLVAATCSACAHAVLVYVFPAPPQVSL